MKKVFTLLTLALLSISSAWADEPITVTFSYDKINATGTGTASVASVIETTSVALTGTHVSLLKFNGTGSASTYNSVSVPAYSKVSVSNDGTSGDDDGIRFTITPAEGCTFTPTSVSMGAIREGTDGGSMYVYANGTAINEATLAKSPVIPGRNKTGDGYLKDGYTFSYNISAVTATPEAPLTIDVCMSALKNKSWGLWNVVITGTYTKEKVTTYTLTTTADPAAGGTITRSPNQAAYQASKSVTLTATPNYGYEFVNWTKDDVVVSTSASYAITTAAAAETYVAHFNALTTYALTVSANNDAYGTVAKSPDHETYLAGEEVTLTATPKTGYGFVNWTRDDVEVSTSASYNITTTAAATEYVANFVPLYSITFDVDAENKGTSSTGFATQYANTSNKWTAPINYYVAKEGYTLTAWNDGENDYTPGTEYTLTNNITIAPVFTANTNNLSDLTAETTITWPFATDNGAPTLSSEGNTQYYVKQTTIGGNSVDVPIFVNTVQDYGISGKKGKFDGRETYAQVNAGTVFKIPAVKNMVVKYMTNQTTAVDKIGFTDDPSVFGVSSPTVSPADSKSGDSKTLTYTYHGLADYLYLIDVAGGKYPTGLSVTYPVPPTQWDTPVITPANGSLFAGESQSVTITSPDGADIYYTLDGTTPTSSSIKYTDAFNISNTTTIKAIAIKDGLGDSEMATATISKAVGVEKTWDFTNWSAATVTGVTGDDTKWYQYEQASSNGINYGDANGRTNIQTLGKNTITYGSTIIPETQGLKFTTTGTHQFALIFNLPSATVSSTEYTYEGSQYIWLYNSNAKIVISNVAAGSTLEVGVESHNGGDNRGLTVSGVDGITQTEGEATSKTYQVCKWSIPTAGEITIAPTKGLHVYYIKATQNVASVPVSTKADRNYATMVTPAGKKLDFANAEGITAYIATGLNGAKDAVVLKEVDVVPGETPIIVKTDTKGATVNVPVTSADADDVSGNKLVAGDGTTAWNATANTTYYYLASDQFHEATSGTLQSGKAYLAVTSGGAPQLSIVFGDSQTTGINAVNSEGLKVQGSEVYNLNGQRVLNPTKGLYIVNGRKVVVK